MRSGRPEATSVLSLTELLPQIAYIRPAANPKLSSLNPPLASLLTPPPFESALFRTPVVPGVRDRIANDNMIALLLPAATPNLAVERPRPRKLPLNYREQN